MTGSTRWIVKGAALLAGLGLLTAVPAMAQDTDAQAARATDVYNDAATQSRAGNYAGACRGFANAEVMFGNAINSLYSHSMATDEDRDYVKGFANHLQGLVDRAKEAGKAACHLRDIGATAEDSPSPATQSSSDDLDSQKERLQNVAQRAKAEYQEADRLYDAGDRPAACTSARASAASFAQVAAALRENSALESAFANAAQIFANADQAAHDRDAYYCRS